jgi:hypothetical protein
MKSMIEKVADRLLGLFVPALEAEAQVCEFPPCVPRFCYCRGPRYFMKMCCKTESGSTCCLGCQYKGNYCGI